MLVDYINYVINYKQVMLFNPMLKKQGHSHNNLVKSEQEDEPETSPDDKQDELIDDNSKPVNDDMDSQNAEHNKNNEIKTVWTGSDDADSHAINHVRGHRTSGRR